MEPLEQPDLTEPLILQELLVQEDLMELLELLELQEHLIPQEHQVQAVQTVHQELLELQEQVIHLELPDQAVHQVPQVLLEWTADQEFPLHQAQAVQPVLMEQPETQVLQEPLTQADHQDQADLLDLLVQQVLQV